MSPGPVERLKPYFKPRRRGGAAPPAQPQPAGRPGAAAPSDSATTTEAPAAASPGTATPPQAAADGLHARREQLTRRYAELQSDLGGLAYEMAIRDAFKLELLVRRAAELQTVDSELGVVERQLGLAPAPASPAPASTPCSSCGAALPPGSQYCPRCGSAVVAAGGAG